METCVQNGITIRSAYFFGRFGRLSVIKNLMTLISHNTSAEQDALRSENLKKTKLTTTIDETLMSNLSIE